MTLFNRTAVVLCSLSFAGCLTGRSGEDSGALRSVTFRVAGMMKTASGAT